MWPFRKKKKQPVYPAALIAEAKRNPGGTVCDIDATVGSQWGEVPPCAIRGGWAVNDRGELTGAYKENPNYDPAKLATWVADRTMTQKVQ